MNDTRLTAAGALLLRVALGVLFLVHGLYLKAVVYTLPGTAGYFESIGLPGLAAYLVVLVETAAGAALIAGFHTRLAALALLPVSIGATWAHLGAGWLFTNEGGGWEFPAFLAVTVAVQALLGGGALALTPDGAPRRARNAAAPGGAAGNVA